MKHRHYHTSMRSTKMLIIFICMFWLLLASTLLPLFIFRSTMP